MTEEQLLTAIPGIDITLTELSQHDGFKEEYTGMTEESMNGLIEEFNESKENTRSTRRPTPKARIAVISNTEKTMQTAVSLRDSYLNDRKTH